MNEKFCLTIEYDKTSANPEQVFYGDGKMLEAMKHMDKNLASCIDSDIAPVLLLEDVERGSVRLWLKNHIESLPDEVLATGEPKKILGHFLVEAKYAVLSFLEGKDSIAEVKEVEVLESQIFEMAKETKAQSLDCYQPPIRKNLLESMSEMGEAFSYFREKECVYLETSDNQRILINKNFRLPLNNIEKLCEGETITNHSTAVLKLKQPDFLGDSQWVFRHGSQTLKAKMADDKWLQDYKDRKFAVYPGDSLRVRLETTTTYGSTHEVISEKFFVVEVIEIVSFPETEQMNFEI